MTGIVGGCLLIGGIKFKEQNYGLDGISAALTVLTAISVLTLILPNYTTSVEGPIYNNEQLIFVSFVSLILYGSFLLMQTVKHRDYFLPLDASDHEEVHEVALNQLGWLYQYVFINYSLGFGCFGGKNFVTKY